MANFAGFPINSIGANGEFYVNSITIANLTVNTDVATDANKTLISAGGGSLLTNGQLSIGNTGNPPSINTITAGTNVTITNGAGTIKIDAFASGSGSFTTLAATNTTNQLVLGTTNTITITAPTPAASRIYTLPDAGAAASFMLTAGNQTASGIQTFSNATASSATNNGAVIVTGGLGVGGDVRAGLNVWVPATNASISLGSFCIGANTNMHAYDGSGTDSNIYLGPQAGLSGLATAAAKQNTAVGAQSMFAIVSASDSTFVGFKAGYQGVGSQHVGIGSQALQNVGGGTGTICIGYKSGISYNTNESNNICIANAGVVGDSGVIRIGTVGTHTTGVIPGAIQMGNAANSTEGIYLNNSVASYTPSLLGYYEEATSVLTGSGAFSNGPAMTAVYRRIGTFVMCFIPSTPVITASTTASGIYSTVPARFRPATIGVAVISLGYVNSVTTTCYFSISSAGVISFFANAGFNSWTAGIGCQWENFSFTYYI